MGLTNYPPGLALPLDASDIANGTVSDAEYQYLNGVTSAIQTQLNALSATAPLTSYLAATVTYNNNAVLADTALSVTVAAATKYAIQLVVHSTNVTKSLNMDFGGTATQTSFIGGWTGMAYSSGTYGNTGLKVTAAGTDFGSTDYDLVPVMFVFTGSMLTNAGGTFLLRGAQLAADASDTTILAGSTLILTPMS